MNRRPLLVALCSVAALPAIVLAHCQVPCGIYGDQLRFESMLEDEHTISKAQSELAKLVEEEVTPQTVNQMVRWTTTKEDHATKIQKTISDYFMAQRIKTDDGEYGKKLMAAHKVMVAAMKAKQSADPATAKALEDAIFDFYRAYEGKEPAFEHSH